MNAPVIRSLEVVPVADQQAYAGSARKRSPAGWAGGENRRALEVVRDRISGNLEKQSKSGAEVGKRTLAIKGTTRELLGVL